MRLPPPLWLFARRWRRRYGKEVLEMYARSRRPISDWLDLFRTGSVSIMEETMRSRLVQLLVVMCALFAGGAIYTISELAGGIREAPDHWWSTAPYVGLLMSLAALVLIVGRRRTADD